MMATRFTLESFDSGTARAEVETLEYRRGFEDGLAEGNASIEIQAQKAITELTATLNDLAFGYEEARQQMLSKVAPIMIQISDLIVPAILEETFQQHLSEMLTNTVEAGCADGFEILVSPENADLLKHSDLGVSVPYRISPSVDLVAGQAAVITGEANQLLDLNALLETLSNALRGIDQSNWSKMNG